MSDKILEKLLEYLISLGPAAIFVVVAINECRLYLDPNETGNLWKAFGFALAAATWVFVAKTLKELWDEIWQAQRQPLANCLVKQLDRINQKVGWKLSSFDRKYLECQSYDCLDYRVEGYQPYGIKMLMLEEVYVPLALAGQKVEDLAARMVMQQRKTQKAGDREAEVRQMRREIENSWQIWHFLAQTEADPSYRRMAILAAVGYGKTTLLKHIALSYAKQLSVVKEHKAPKKIPILLYLRDLREMLARPKDTFPSLPDLIHTHHLQKLPKPKTGELNPPTDWAATLLQTGKALVMIDGFDEVAEDRRDDVSEWLSAEMRQYPRSVFLLTSRPPAYENHFTAEKPETNLYIRAFNDEQREEFVVKWYGCQERYDRGGRDTPDVQQLAEQRAASLLRQLESRPKLSAMADNPLLLNMIATFHRFHVDDELPKHRARLYQAICKLQLFDRPRAKGIPMLLSQEKSQDLLQIIALGMMQHPDGRITSATGQQLEDWVRERLRLINHAVKPSDWIEQIEEVSELLLKKDDTAKLATNVYEFAHLSFQEFLAAAQIKKLGDEAILLQRFEDTEWRETILLYAAQLDDPTPLVQEACRRNSRDALQLGYDTVRESPNPVQVEAVFRDLQDKRYARLDALLAQGQWRDADLETFHMMLRTVGKSEDDYFSLEDLRTFPCDDLQRIDRLWVHYSKGKWGFSVQKRIYVEECGATPDGNYPGDKIWEDFGDRVGWRKDGSWQSYDNLTFDLSISPAGEFPVSDGGAGFVWVGGCWWGGFCGVGGCVSFLAQRLVNCSTSQS